MAMENYGAGSVKRNDQTGDLRILYLLSEAHRYGHGKMFGVMHFCRGEANGLPTRCSSTTKMLSKNVVKALAMKAL